MFPHVWSSLQAVGLASLNPPGGMVVSPLKCEAPSPHIPGARVGTSFQKWVALAGCVGSPPSTEATSSKFFPSCSCRSDCRVVSCLEPLQGGHCNRRLSWRNLETQSREGQSCEGEDADPAEISVQI